MFLHFGAGTNLLKKNSGPQIEFSHFVLLHFESVWIFMESLVIFFSKPYRSYYLWFYSPSSSTTLCSFSSHSSSYSHMEPGSVLFWIVCGYEMRPKNLHFWLAPPSRHWCHWPQGTFLIVAYICRHVAFIVGKKRTNIFKILWNFPDVALPTDLSCVSSCWMPWKLVWPLTNSSPITIHFLAHSSVVSRPTFTLVELLL